MLYKKAAAQAQRRLTHERSSETHSSTAEVQVTVGTAAALKGGALGGVAPNVNEIPLALPTAPVEKKRDPIASFTR